jgi:hypothetical protein
VLFSITAVVCFKALLYFLMCVVYMRSTVTVEKKNYLKILTDLHVFSTLNKNSAFWYAVCLHVHVASA